MFCITLSFEFRLKYPLNDLLKDYFSSNVTNEFIQQYNVIYNLTVHSFQHVANCMTYELLKSIQYFM